MKFNLLIDGHVKVCGIGAKLLETPVLIPLVS